ncbi:DUF2933 domain-containing protein [Ralstonia chuxiongensis]|uniref:DUF2933 domain-containing protein n=1 Tax=Ralstonia chuxiongensis TaxID=2957504 RepID=UPI0028F62841|nr:DUF2933 domain-containing protein [Ralstonia chuxiongensis]CAJ0784284.1 hypothetical protein R8510_05239 [Ralstonia chuxiongensis]
MDHHEHENEREVHGLVSRSKVVLVGFLLVIAYFLFTEHRAHVLQFLPFLLLASCPLMHLFMHGGHGHGHHHGRQQDSENFDTKGER